MAGEGLVVKSGKTLRARLLAGEASLGLLWLAVGDGDWDDIEGPPPEDPDHTLLVHETARKHIDRIAYLELDNINGTIPFDGDLYKEVTGPTAILAVYAKLSEDEGPGLEIREEGLFAADTVTTANPYADTLLGEVLVSGTMYWVRNRAIYTKGDTDVYSIIAIFREE